MFKCEFCEKELKTKSNIDYHQKTAKYCLEKQGKENVNFKCNYCKKKFTKKQTLINHTEICISKPLDDEINKLKKYILDLESQNLIKDKIIEEKDKIIKKSELKNKELEDKLYKILEKAVDKPTTTNNTTNNTNIEKLEIISPTFLDEQAQYLTIDHIKNGANGYANFFLEHQLKDRIVCTDFSRRKLKYKDENGEVITDPEMNTLSILLFSSIKTRNRDLTIKYMDELINKEQDQEYFMKIAQSFGEQDLEFTKILNGEKNGMYHDIVRTLCSRILIK
jgi:hypothetical protein